MNFVVGQRWISNAETELGLGIISHVEHRHITISFPAAATERVYAKDSAPISRITYRGGDQVESIDGDLLQITEVNEANDYVTYQCLNQQGETVILEEVELDCFIQLSKPLDRLLAGQVDKPSDYQLRIKALNCQQHIDNLDSTGLVGPRVQLLPHQLYIAHEVGNRFAPRVLLADEVGLGKTIEAGLILHKQLLKGLCNRVLIIVPDSLIHQWLVEMMRRFNLHFSILDSQRCLAIEESQEINPFDSEQLVICPISLFTENPQRLNQALEAGWDALVVDEAHHLEWHPDNVSTAYQVVEELSKISSSVILLTATPEQLGVDGHFARLKLLDPDRYFDLPKFIEEQDHFREINDLVELLQSGLPLDKNSQSAKLLIEKLPSVKLNEINDDASSAELRAACIEDLLDQYGTGRVLFRNTRKAITGFPGRKLNSYVLADNDSSSIETDPRVDWLSGWLKENRQRKALIICQQAETAVELQQFLNLRRGVASAAFHDHLTLIERDRAAAYFADSIDGAQVLVCSEIGSEGRNFQFSHDLVMFDLPENPDLLEQRIGRLDRIGQTNTISIHVPVIEGSDDHRLLQWFHLGLNAFEQTCVAASRLYRELGIEKINAALTDDSLLAPLISTAKNRLLELKEEMDNGSNHMLELNSCRPEVAEPLIEELQELNQSSDLKGYLEQVFDHFGIDQERHSEDSFVIRPSDHMQIEHLPGLPEEGLTGTLSRDSALSRDDLSFLNWEHPLVRSSLDILLNSERGNCTVNTVKLKPLKPGTLLLEGTYKLLCSAPSFQKLGRFLEESLVRVLLDNQKRVLSQALSAEQLSQLAAPVKTATARQIIKSTKADLESLTQHMDKLVASKQPELIAAAQEKASVEFDLEIKRLTDLARKNPNIRTQEIDYQLEQKNITLSHLSAAKFQLDALRVIIVT